MTTRPAAETAAAVKSPDIDAATVRVARMRVMTSINTAARGVLIADVMDIALPS